MRGLNLFITDIRKCRGKEEELKRIYKELANIRSKFKGDKPLKGYDKKKYISKMIFMFLLGYECDFGYIEAINLLSSNSYSEKQVGYLFISVVMRSKHEFLPLVINAIRNDLSSSNYVFQNLALQFLSNNANIEMAEALSHEVLEILVSSNSVDLVKQTGALALLQLLRNKPDLVIREQIANRIIHLLSSHHLGVVTASASLLEFLTAKYPSQYESCLSHVIIRLSRIITAAVVDFQDYTYYFVAAPWLTVKLLRLLKSFPPPNDASLKNRLRECLELSLNKAQEPIKSKRFEHNNAKYMIIFESISLIIQMDIDTSLLLKATSILVSALSLKDPNLRLIALEMMSVLSTKENCRDTVKKHWELVLNALKTERDITIKMSAINLLYSICDRSNMKQITEEMLHFLQTQDQSSREEVILKTAAIAERFNIDLEFYVDTMFNILQICANDVNDNVWYALIKVIGDNHRIQEYAARTAFAILQQNPCHDILVKVTGYILGEFGYLIAKDPRCGYLMQLNLLKKNYHACTPSTRALLLTTYMKFLNLYPELKREIQLIFRQKCNIESADEEIQQRAVEYLRLSQVGSKSLLATVLEVMPSAKQKHTAVALEMRKGNQAVLNIYHSGTSRTRKIMPSRSVMDIGNITENSGDKQTSVSKSASSSDLPLVTTSTNVNLLVELFNDVLNLSDTVAPNCTKLKPSIIVPRDLYISSNEMFLSDLLFSETGTLFEDICVYIHIQCEFRRHFGRFHLTYKNKSTFVLTNFSVEGNFCQLESKCSIWFKPTVSMLDAQKSMEQDIHLECLNEFCEKPSLILRFNFDNNHREIKLILPLTINKFVEPSTMSPNVFIKRWQNIENPIMQYVREFTARYSMVGEVIQRKIMGFRLSVIENVEPNSSSLFCAGIFYSREFRVGLLLRLERYPDTNSYRSIIRCSRPSFSQKITNLLTELL